MKDDNFSPKKKESANLAKNKDTKINLKRIARGEFPRATALGEEPSKNPHPKLRQNFKNKVGEPSDEFSKGTPTESKLKTEPQFTVRQNKKLAHLEKQLNKAESKYFKAEGKLPTHKKMKLIKRKQGEKARFQIHFEEEIKAPKEKLQILAKPKQVLKQGVSSAVKSTGAMALEGGEREKSFDEVQTRKIIDKGIDVAGSTVNGIFTAPKRFMDWRTKKKFEKLDKAGTTVVKHDTTLGYSRFRFERKNKFLGGLRQESSLFGSAKNPTSEATKSSTSHISRALQKRRFAKKYRKSLKEKSIKIGKSVFQKAISLTNGITKHLKKIGLVMVAIFLLFTLIGSCMQGAGNVSTGIFKGIFSTSYMADDEEIADSDWYFSELEGGFEEQIKNTETVYPNQDEYHYFLNGTEVGRSALAGAIGHDPFQFISFISVMHEDFKFAGIQGDILEFFHVMYQLDFQRITETRYHTAYDDAGNSYQESYQYYILNVHLTVADWDTVIKPYIDSKDGERQYDEYINSGGNHQMFGTPFNFNWYDKITCQYGGRDNPTGANTGSITANGQEMHTGLDIGVPTGTPIYSIMQGKVTFAGWHNLYGYYVDVTDKDGNKSRYAHCSNLKVAVGDEVKRGQALALSGATGNVTGAHLHIEIFLGGKRVNPIFLIQYQPTNDKESET